MADLDRHATASRAVSHYDARSVSSSTQNDIGPRTLSHAESLSNGIAGSRLVVLETGHTSCVEAPDEFAKVIRAVVEQGLRAGTRSAD
jgi:pimeloyl-ACP methyl ester carboxylesterase